MLRSKIHIALLLLFLSGLSLQSCVEEIDISEQLKFEDVIVIEANITNELKEHLIFVSRSFRFEEEGPRPEQNASVEIEILNQGIIAFDEIQPGVYQARNAFQAENGLEYKLNVRTNAGKSYTTLPRQLTQSTPIDEVYPIREVNSIGTDIVSIKVDAFDPSNSSNYYRYEYEETYKIIAPNWVPKDFVILQDEYGNDLAFPGFEPRSLDERVCYATDSSNTIIQTSTTNLTEDRVSAFAVRNISTQDPILQHRYSILVRQYVQSLDAFSYYDVLNQLTGSSDILSQIQPGFISSNIFSTEDRDEKVLGFFDVASVDERRIFFDYEDLFPGEPLPPYFIDCRTSTPVVATMGGTPLKDGIQAGIIKYFKDNVPQGENEGPFEVVPTPCGDCTVLGSSEIPEFWEE